MLGSVRDKYRSAFRLPLHPGPWRNLLLEGLQEKIRLPYLAGSTACVSSSNHGWLKTDHLRCHTVELQGHMAKSITQERNIR